MNYLSSLNQKERFIFFMEITLRYQVFEKGCNNSCHWQDAQNRFLLSLTQIKNLLDMIILAFIPTILLGVFRGLLGAFFCSLNLKMNQLHMQFFYSIPKSSLRKTNNLLETVFIFVSK